MTAMKEAFKAVGIVAADEKLRDCAVRSLMASNNNWDRAKDNLYKYIKNDADLLWTLFEPYRLIAVQKLLTEVVAEMRASEKAERGHPTLDNQKTNAPLSQTNGKQLQAAKPSGSGHTQYEYQGSPARPAPIISSPRIQPPIRDHREGMKAVISVARLSMLDLFKINKKPIGDLTSREATAWAGSQERQTRFVRLITQNLPPDLPIRKFITPEEADALYERAGEMSDV